MNREIKFRGLDKFGKWHYGYVYLTDKGCFIIDPEIASLKDAQDIFDFCHQAKSETVGQYTGLKDKNGKEIYEGDIVLFYTHYYYHKESSKKLRKGYKGGGVKGVVEITDGLLTPFYDSTYTEDEQGDWFQSEYGFEIIGNIYEHPHLLK